MPEKIMMCARGDGKIILGEGDLDQAVGMIVFKRPRLLEKDNQGGVLVCLEMIGRPKSIPLPLKTESLIYEVHDETIIEAYNKSVTGLVLP